MSIKSMYINYECSSKNHICQVDGQDFTDSKLIISFLMAYDLLNIKSVNGETCQSFKGTVTNTGLVLVGDKIGV